MSVSWLKQDEVLQVLGDLTADTVMQLREQGERLLAASAARVVSIDFSGVGYSGSAGLALILAWQRYARRSKKKCHMTHLPAALLSIASVCGLNNLTDEE